MCAAFSAKLPPCIAASGAGFLSKFSGIKGAEAYNSCDPTKADCAALKAAVGIKAVNKYTLQITLTSPQPWFIQQLSHTSFLPVYKPAVGKYGAKFTEAANFVGNGPFKLTSWKHDASHRLNVRRVVHLHRECRRFG